MKARRKCSTRARTGTLIQHFKDDATAFNAKKHALIEGKGVLNNRISEYIFQRLGEIGVPTHFLKRLNMREQLIREVEIIRSKSSCANVAAGSLATRLGLEEGVQLPRSIIEFYYKADSLNDRWCRKEHITPSAGPHRKRSTRSCSSRCV